jgi:PKD repeat protein
MPPTWTDRRPIAQIIHGSYASRSAINPRGWFSNSTLNALDPTAFRTAALARINADIAVLTGMTAQGGVFWDLDGAQYPDASSGLTSNVSYLGDPVRLGTTTPAPTLNPEYPESSGSGWAPEMNTVADELMGLMTAAGLKVGMTIRPSTVVLGGLTGQLIQQAPTDEAAAISVLDAKITYCKNRWGATLFYIDTPYWGSGTVISGTGWTTLYGLHPDVLLMPESPGGNTPPTGWFASVCPYTEADLGYRQTADANRPGFSLLNMVDDDLTNATNRAKLVVGVRGGDIPMFRGWFNDQPQNANILGVYQDGTLAGVTAVSNVVVSTVAGLSYGYTGRYPDSVADLTATAISPTLIRVTFTPPDSGGAYDYVLERSTDLGVSWSTISTIIRNTTQQYDDTGRTAGVPNRYRITPRNFWGTGPKTTTADVFTNSGVVRPVADFVGSPLNGSVPFNVQLTDQSQNGPTSWTWSATNGWTSTLQNPVLPITTSGFTSVTLTATNAAGGNTVTKANYVASTNPVPPPPPPPPPGTLQFSASTYSVNENGGSATIAVTRTGGSFGALSATYATSDGTATAGMDYTAVSGTFNWADADAASKTFVVPILDDATVEGNETVNLTLTSAALGTPSAAVLTIIDNDVTPPPTPTATDRPWEVWVSPGDSSARVEVHQSPTFNVTGYNFYQGTISGFTPGPSNLIGTTDASTLFLDVGGLTNGVPVFFAASAVGPAGESSIIQARVVGTTADTSTCTPRAGKASVNNAIVGHQFHWDFSEVSAGTSAVLRNSVLPYGPQPLCEEPVGAPTTFVPSATGPSGRLIADMRHAGFRLGPNVGSGGRVLQAEVGDGDFAIYAQVKFDSTVSPFSANGMVFCRGTVAPYSFAVQRISGTTATTLRLTYSQRDGTVLTADLLNAASTSEWRMVCVQFARTAPPADAGVVTIRVVTAAGTILTASGNYTRGPRLEANPVRFGSRNGTANFLQGWMSQAGVVRGTISDAQLIWLANNGNGRAASEIRALPIPNPGLPPVGYPRDHGLLLDGRDGPNAYTVTPTGPGDDGRRSRGLYWFNYYPFYQWSPTLSAARGRYLVCLSTDHDNGTNGGALIGYTDQIGGIPASMPKRIPHNCSQTGRSVTGMETPRPWYEPGDPTGKTIYMMLHGPVSGTAVSPYNPGANIRQESQLFRTTDPDSTWEYVGPCVPLSLRDTYATLVVDHTHTGYQFIVPALTLGAWQTQTMTWGLLSDNYANSYFNGSGNLATSTPLSGFPTSPTEEFLDHFTRFHPYVAASSPVWFQNVFTVGVSGVGVGRGGWVNDAGVTLTATRLYGLEFVGGSYRRATGQSWMLRPGTDAFPTTGYVQDTRAQIEDGILHIFQKTGYPPDIGYDLLYWATCVADATVAAGARPVGTKAVAAGGGVVNVTVRDALPHKNYRLYRKAGAGSYAMVAIAPPTQAGTLITYADTVSPGSYTYQVRTVNGATETAGADLTVTAT